MPVAIDTLDDVADKQDLEIADKLIKEGLDINDDAKVVLGNKVRQTVAMTRAQHTCWHVGVMGRATWPEVRCAAPWPQSLNNLKKRIENL